MRFVKKLIGVFHTVRHEACRIGGHYALLVDDNYVVLVTDPTTGVVAE
jgi:hypothetical protein